MPIYDDSKYSTKEITTEWLRMKLNPLYFITNYIYTDIAGGKILLDFDHLHDKHIAFIKSVYNLHEVIFFASRRTGKTTITSAYLLWVTLFHPNFKTLIVIHKTDTGKELLEKIKFMYSHLPQWIKKIVPRKSKAEKVSYIDFANNSKIFYAVPSSQRPADTIGRGMNLPGIYVDEAAFIPLDKLFSSLRPAYRSAKNQAIKSKYPYFFIITSTPDGRLSYPGRVFYEYYTHAIPIDELYDFSKHDWKCKPPLNCKLKLMEKNKFYNDFVKIRLHYSELPDTSWVEEEKQALHYYTSVEGRRRWNQEYELLFLGSQDNIFPDDVIEQFEPQKPLEIIDIGQNIQFKLWIDSFDENNWYIFGIDTAKSIDGDYSAVEVFDLKNFEQIGELKHRFGSVTDFARVIIKMIFTLISEYGLRSNFTLGIESVGIGNTAIEYLLNYPDFDFSPYIFKTKLKSKNRYEYGIPTNSTLKKEMIDIFYMYIVQNPKRIKSYDLIEELQIVERKNNKIGAPPGLHDDLFMASVFTAYVRYNLLKQPGYINPEILKDIDEDFRARYEKMSQYTEQFLQLAEHLNTIYKDDQTNRSIVPIYDNTTIREIREKLEIENIQTPSINNSPISFQDREVEEFFSAFIRNLNL